MESSDCFEKLISGSGIMELMDDLAKNLPKESKIYPLGGGNPARIKEVEELWLSVIKNLLDSNELGSIISAYDSPQGRVSFLSSLSNYFRSRYNFNISEKNISITNGSQSAAFYLVNLLSGKSGNKKSKILFPLMPEYIGYADLALEKDTFISVPAKVEEISEHEFKYVLDKDEVKKRVECDNSISAIIISRPTNPTGNVLTDDEVEFLAKLCKENNIYLIIDNAYGYPFPGIIFEDASLYYDENTILLLSLSKIGLPSIRTGIVIAKEEIINALSSINAIAALTPGSLGQALCEKVIVNGELERVSREVVSEYYKRRRDEAIRYIQTYFKDLKYKYHKVEGSIFIWLYLPSLKIKSKEFYAILKSDGVITVPAEYFFFGSGGENHEHKSKCLRLNYSGNAVDVEKGIMIIANRYKEFSK